MANTLHHCRPDPDAVAPLLKAVGIDPIDMDLVVGPATRIIATLQTPNGIVEFG